MISMAKKFMLISVQDREFDSPKFFKTHAEAYQAMKRDLANCLETDVEHLGEHEGLEDEFDYDDEHAWITDNACCFNVDWQIIELSEAIMQDD